jgi:hypothetical protein
VKSVQLHTGFSGGISGDNVQRLQLFATMNVPPNVAIKAPANNATVPFGALNSITFQAAAVDYEDSNCCKMVWTSDFDGQIGIGAKVVYSIPTAGPRTCK